MTPYVLWFVWVKAVLRDKQVLVLLQHCLLIYCALPWCQKLSAFHFTSERTRGTHFQRQGCAWRLEEQNKHHLQ